MVKMLSQLLTMKRGKRSGACRQLLRRGMYIQLHLVCQSKHETFPVISHR